MAEKYIARVAYACSNDDKTRIVEVAYSALEEISELEMPYETRKKEMMRVVALANSQGVDPFDLTNTYDRGMYLDDVLEQWVECPDNPSVLQLMVECGLDPATPVGPNMPVVLAAALSGNRDAFSILRASPKYRPVPTASTYIELLQKLL